MRSTSYQEEWDDPREDPVAAALAARLTEAAYGVALRHGVKGSFVDLELALWGELRRVVAAAGVTAAPAPAASAA